MLSRSIALCLAVSGFALLTSLPLPAAAGPGVAAKPEAGNALVQETGYYKRRWRRGSYVRAPFAEVDTRGDTWVAAPFARVFSGRRGTWVRAPFVNLWVPR